MGRIKGTKLTAEQKEKMSAARMKKAKKLESEVRQPKIKKSDVLIKAYGFMPEDDHPVPIFSSEFSSYKGKMFKTLDKAAEALKGRK